MKPIDKFYSLIITTIIIALCCTLIVGWIPIFSREWFFVLSASFLSIIFYSKILKLKYIIPLMIYGLVVYLNVFGGDQKFDFVFSTMEFFSFFLVTSVFVIYSQPYFSKSRHNFLYCYLAVIVVTFIGTSLVYMKEPEVLRMILSETNVGNFTLYTIYSKLGVESYSMGHALSCLIPILVYSIKRNNNIYYKLLLILLLFFIFALIFMSTATTALLLAIILLILSFIWNEKNKSKNIITLVICLCFGIIFILNRDLLSNILNNIDIDSQTTYAGKLNDFKDYANYGKAGDQTQGRFDLYIQSLETFLSSPIFGINEDDNLGGHSIFFDRLALLGLVGFVPLVLFLYYYIKYVLKKLSKAVKPYCLFGFFSFITLACLKNIFGFEYLAISLLIMPLTCLLVDDHYNKYI